MPYSHTSWGDLKDGLVDRLGGGAFWTDTATFSEVGGYLREAMRLYAALSLRWKKRVTFNLTSGDRFYDLAPHIGFQNVTNREVAAQALYHLLEPPDTSTWSWIGTEQFTIAQVANAIREMRDQFLLETGIRLVRRDQAVSSPNASGRYELTTPAIAVQRITWLPGVGNRVHLWREDEFQANSLAAGWHSSQDAPSAYSVAVTPPITVQLIKPPSAAGTMEMVLIEPGADMDLASSTPLGIPDNLAWAVKWGVVADLLSKDGQARDHQRADYATNRYQMGVKLALLNPSVAVAYVNGAHVPVVSLQELDAMEPEWESTTPGQPQVLALAGHNLAAFWPTPDADYGVELDVTAEAPIPATDGADVQIGQEELSAISDMAFHLACFKMGADELSATMQASENLFAIATAQNERIRGFTTSPEPLHDRSQRERKRRRYRESSADQELPAVVDNA